MHLFDRGEPLDKITVAEELRRREVLDRVGGVPYLSALMDTVQTAASATYYARIVREKSILRSLIHAGTQITQLGTRPKKTWTRRSTRPSSSCSRSASSKGPASSCGQPPDERRVRPDRSALPSARRPHRPHVGLSDIDEMTTGFQPGNFVIVAARPGMGKTSFALNMTVAAARESQKPIAFFSLEMSNDELLQRLICSESRISMHDLRRGNIKQHQWKASRAR